jgi:hypothetical protein
MLPDHKGIWDMDHGLRGRRKGKAESEDTSTSVAWRTRTRKKPITEVMPGILQFCMRDCRLRDAFGMCAVDKTGIVCTHPILHFTFFNVRNPKIQFHCVNRLASDLYLARYWRMTVEIDRNRDICSERMLAVSSSRNQEIEMVRILFIVISQ